MRLSRSEISLAIAIIEKHWAETVPPADILAAWRALRGELSIARRQSETMLPRVAEAAQHLEKAKSNPPDAHGAASNASAHAAEALRILDGIAQPEAFETIPPPKKP